MKPEATSSNLNPEQLPSHIESGVEKTPILNTPEKSLDKGAEAYERKSDLGAIRADIGLTTIQPVPTTNTTTMIDDTVLSSNPAVANDDDLIEKEWVDKAKKIVADTQNNPHKRDEEVNKLQIDYLKKRFGRELGVAE